MPPAHRSSAGLDASPTETQKAVFLSARDNRQSRFPRVPLCPPHTLAGTAASSPSRSSPCISVSADQKRQALVLQAPRQVRRETSARPQDELPVNTSSMTTRAPSSRVP